MFCFYFVALFCMSVLYMIIILLSIIVIITDIIIYDRTYFVKSFCDKILY